MPGEYVPLCPSCGDPVITSGCYPGYGVCGNPDDADDLTSTYESVWPSADDVPPNAGSMS